MQVTSLRWQNWSAFAIGAAVFLCLVVACGGSHADQATSRSVPEARTVAATPVFDVPALIGMDIDQVRKRLGPPAEDSADIARGDEMGIGVNDFGRGADTLLVMYDPHTRRVTEFFIDTNDPSGTTTTYRDLLPVIHATDTASAYAIVPVRLMQDPTRYTGIRIVPTNAHSSHE